MDLKLGVKEESLKIKMRKIVMFWLQNSLPKDILGTKKKLEQHEKKFQKVRDLDDRVSLGMQKVFWRVGGPTIEE